MHDLKEMFPALKEMFPALIVKKQRAIKQGVLTRKI